MFMFGEEADFQGCFTRTLTVRTIDTIAARVKMPAGDFSAIAMCSMKSPLAPYGKLPCPEQLDEIAQVLGIVNLRPR